MKLPTTKQAMFGKAPAIRTSTTRAYLSRRAFLRGAGASLALLPMLESERARGATGTITLDSVAQNFTDAIGLVGLLAKSPEVRACFAGEWSRFALDRLDTDADAASLQSTAAAFASDTASVQDLMAAVATMRSFR